MKVTSLFILILVLILQSASAQVEQKYAKIQLEKELARELHSTLSTALKDINFELQVLITSKPIQKLSAPGRANLPGFTVDQSRETYGEPNAVFNLETVKAKILGQAESATVTVSFDEKNISRIDQEKLKNLIRGQLSYINIPIFSKVATVPEIVAKERAPASVVESSPKSEQVIINNEMPKFSPIINANLKMPPVAQPTLKERIIVWISDKLPLIGIGLALLWSLAQFSKVVDKASRRVTEALDLKQSSGSTSTNKPESSLSPTSYPLSGPPSPSEERKEFTLWVHEHEKIVQIYVSECIKMKQYIELLVFMDVWPEIVKAAWNAEGVSLQEFNLFNDYFRQEGKKLLMNDQKLSDLRRQVQFNMKNIILDDKAYHMNGTISSVSILNPNQFWDLFVKLSVKEKSLLVSIIPNTKLAEYVVADPEKINEIKKVTIINDLKEDDLKNLGHKISQFGKKSFVPNKLEELSRLLPHKEEKALLGVVSPKSKTAFENYRDNYFADMVKWIKGLEFEESAQLLATFSEEMRNDILQKMPQIKARRLAMVGFKMGEKSAYLKANLIEYLEKLSTLPALPIDKSDKEVA